MKSMRVAYLGLLAVLACGGDPAGEDTDWQQLWLETAPQQYVAKVCSTGFTVPSCTISAVDAGVAVAEQYQVADDPWQDEVPPSDVVAGILNAATRDPEQGCKRRVTQHETYAFPSSVYSDCGEEGWGIMVSCFVPDTLDLERCR